MSPKAEPFVPLTVRGILAARQRAKREGALEGFEDLYESALHYARFVKKYRESQAKHQRDMRARRAALRKAEKR